MKKSIVSTFIISFVLIFSIALTLYIYFHSQTRGMMIASSQSLTKILLLFFISGFVAVLVTFMNYADNQRLRQEFSEDVEHLSMNEEPCNPELVRVANRIKDLSAEIQVLSNPTTEMRTKIVEEERKRISRELHDSVSQELFAATMILSSVESSSDITRVQAQTELALKTLHEAQNEMRALLLHLRPVELDGKSLSIGLTTLINELIAKVSVNINYRLDEIRTQNNIIEDNLFRMAQEILSNTLRHAHAENIEIILREDKYNILLKIKDDGVGFKRTEEKATSYGLSNLKERALLLGGSCLVISAPNEGTSVEIRVPKNNKEDD